MERSILTGEHYRLPTDEIISFKNTSQIDEKSNLYKKSLTSIVGATRQIWRVFDVTYPVCVHMTYLNEVDLVNVYTYNTCTCNV